MEYKEIKTQYTIHAARISKTAFFQPGNHHGQGGK